MGRAKVKIYVEGGGRQRVVNASCREAFKTLTRRLNLTRQPAIVAGGGRDDTLKKFKIALENEPETLCMLLVDSEGPVAPADGDAWEHLRRQAGWPKPDRATADQAHLMVQCMEAWLLADRQAVAARCDSGFLLGALPKGDEIEAIPKADVLRGLERATAKTRAGRLSKGQKTFELLAACDPAKIREASPWADRFFKLLEERLG